MTGEKTLPPPYPIRPDRGMSPFCIRCNEIDEASLLIRDAEAFAAVAHSDEVLEEISDPSRGFCFLEKPDGPYLRGFTREDGCPAFRGEAFRVLSKYTNKGSRHIPAGSVVPESIMGQTNSAVVVDGKSSGADMREGRHAHWTD